MEGWPSDLRRTTYNRLAVLNPPPVGLNPTPSAPTHRKAVCYNKLGLWLWVSDSLLQLGTGKNPGRKAISALALAERELVIPAPVLQKSQGQGGVIHAMQRVTLTIHLFGREIFSLSFEWISSNPGKGFEAAPPLYRGLVCNQRLLFSSHYRVRHFEV